MRCSKCGHDKNETEFYRRSNGQLQDCCKTCYIVRTGDYQRKEKDAVNARARDRYARDPEKYKKQSHDWYASHPDVRRQVQRAYDQAHPKSPERNVEYCNARRARKLNAPGRFTGSEWEQLKADYGNRCLCCGRDDVKLVADHVIPLARGGSDAIDNIQPLCFSCNSKKHTKTIDYRRV